MCDVFCINSHHQIFTNGRRGNNAIAVILSNSQPKWRTRSFPRRLAQLRLFTKKADILRKTQEMDVSRNQLNVIEIPLQIVSSAIFYKLMAKKQITASFYQLMHFYIWRKTVRFEYEPILKTGTSTSRLLIHIILDFSTALKIWKLVQLTARTGRSMTRKKAEGVKKTRRSNWRKLV